MLLLVTQVIRVKILPRKEDLWWTRTHQLWIAKVVKTKRKAKVNWLMINLLLPVTLMIFVTNMRRSRMSSKCLSKSALTWSMTKLLKNVKANRWRSNFQSKLIPSENHWELSKCKMSSYSLILFTVTKTTTRNRWKSNKQNGTKKTLKVMLFLAKRMKQRKQIPLMVLQLKKMLKKKTRMLILTN